MKNIKVICMILASVLFAGFMIGCEPEPEDSPISPLAGKLLILQAYGSANDAQGATHSFVELYNTTEEAINLNDIILYFADGVRGPDVTSDADWDYIQLAGSIPAKGSYLILGPHQGSNVASYDIVKEHGANYGDINDEYFILSNRAFKVVLIQGKEEPSTQNPFNTDGSGKKVNGYIDMVGAVNAPTHATNPDNIFGYETASARCSASEAVRRKDLNDTDNNSVDFVAARYNGMSNKDWEVLHPRNSQKGAWDPFAAPFEPEPVENVLLIFQVGTWNNDGNSISHSFVELYNSGDSPVNLSNYSLQYASARETRSDQAAFSEDDGPWAKINLSGIILPSHSLLIRGDARTNDSTAPLQVPVGDIEAAGFRVYNRGAKIILLSNNTPIENVLASPLRDNPFNIDGNGAKVAGYVDMVGGVNTSPRDAVYGYETNFPVEFTGSKVLRRKSIADTDDNKFDFEEIDYRASNTSMTDAMRAALGPKNLAYGAWNP